MFQLVWGLRRMEADHQQAQVISGSAGFRSGLLLHYTYVLSHSGPIQAGAEKLGICGRVRGRLGTLGRLLVNDLPSQSAARSGGWWKKGNVDRMKERGETVTLTMNIVQSRTQTDCNGSIAAELFLNAACPCCVCFLLFLCCPVLCSVHSVRHCFCVTPPLTVNRRSEETQEQEATQQIPPAPAGQVV